MTNFWEFEVWGTLILIATLLLSLLIANALKRDIKILRNSLIPTSVLGGALLLIASVIYEAITDTSLFDAPVFGGNGIEILEMITYHSLALGFIATSLKSSHTKFTKERSIEVFNTGITTVSTYLLQAVLGLGITVLVSFVFLKDLFPASGLLLPFGYGQGSGQALNYGSIYEAEYDFAGGKSFGLTIAALGFVSAAIGGVIYLNILRRKGIKIGSDDGANAMVSEDVQATDEIPMNGSTDKMTVQVSMTLVVYLLTFIVMYLLGTLVPSLRSVLFGFNFLFGVLFATLFKAVNNYLRKVNIVKKQYINSFLMTRLSGFFFDLMIVAGVAAIRISVLIKYLPIILILAVLGAVTTYLYNLFVAHKLFPSYAQEQFLVMYGMLTGTASTGIILLREADMEFKTPAADNLVYQNFPAIVFGFPLMLIATLAPKKPILALLILAGFFVVMNLILFRSFIFRRKGKS